MTSDLRIKIAESLGWKFHPTPVGGACVNNWEMPNGGYCADCPNWTTDANAALQLVEALAKEGWGTEIIKRMNGTWWVNMEKWGLFGAHHIETSDSFPEAICLAYCAVRGIAEKGKEA